MINLKFVWKQVIGNKSLNQSVLTTVPLGTFILLISILAKIYVIDFRTPKGYMSSIENVRVIVHKLKVFINHLQHIDIWYWF